MTNLKNFLANIIVIATTLIAIMSCNSDQEVYNVPITKSSTVMMDGRSFQTINENIGGNENCNSIYVSTSFRVDNDIRFNLRFELLKNGQLKKMWYDEISLAPGSSNIAKIFLTPNFNPTSTFSIDNFVYDAANNSVSFDFAGTVFLENNVETVKEISGRIENNDLTKTDCNAVNYSIASTNDAFQFHTINYLATKYSSGEQQHRYFSNNGFMMEIKVEDDLWNFENGTYTFEENATNKVAISQYIGPLMADQIQIISPENWQLYTTRGTFTIDEKVNMDGNKIISGKMNLEVLQNDEVLYTIPDIEYAASSFQ